MITCKSCNATIPPAWVNAIKTGICPGCGSELLSEQEKQLVAELSEAFTAMPNNAEGLACWLLTNYRLEKVGDGEPTGFHTAKKQRPAGTKKGPAQVQDDDDDMPAGLKIANNPVQEMLKRTNAYHDIQKTNSKIAAKAKMAQLAQQIQGSDIDEAMYGDGVQTYDTDDEVYIDGEIDDEPRPLVRPSRVLLENSASIVDPEAALSPEELEVVKQLASNAAESVDMQSDPLVVQKLEQAQRIRRIQAQQAINGGGGSFRR